MKKHLKTHPSLIKAFLLIFLVLAFWLPRGLALDQFVTVDEQKWLTRSANFYQALILTDFANTYQRDHPGVTTMWAGMIGFLWQFPDYIRETPGQHKQHLTKNFKSYLEHRGYEPIQLLEAGRYILLTSILIVLAFSFIGAIRLVGLIPAVVGFLLIAFDPFSIGLSRLLRPDALLSPLMLLSLIAFMNFLYRGRHFYDLALAALAAGFAWLTKSPSIFLVPFFGLLSIVEIGRLWWTKRRFSLRDVWNVAWPFLVWAGIAALVFVLIWPAMWVDSFGSLQKIFTEVGDHAGEGHHSATFFNGQIYQAGSSDWLFYPINYLWRTTPTILIGLLLAVFAIIFRRRFSFSKEHQQAALILFLFAVLFTIFMTFGVKKFDRYLLPIFAPLALVAALGWFAIVKSALKLIASFWVIGLKADKVIQISAAILLILVVLIQMIGSLQTFPYYFSYYNPIMGGSRKAPEVMMIGYGEGLDQAARYLNAKPDATKLSVLSWYPDGPFSYIFNGKTLYQGFASNPEGLINADYYVLYYHQWQRQLPSEELIQYFDQQVPEHIVYIDGLEYVRIYRRDTMQPQSQTD